MKQHITNTEETNTDKLNARRNKALALRLEGLTDRAIADKLKLSAGQVNKDIQRATIDAYIFDHEEISKQRNMVTLQIQKLIDSWWTQSIGGVSEVSDFMPWEEYIKVYLTDIWYHTKDGRKFHHTDDEWEHDKYHEDVDYECECEEKEIIFSSQKLAKGKKKWEKENYKTTHPDEKATKIVIDLMQMVIKLWGIEKPINTNPLINNLNSNKDN